MADYDAQPGRPTPAEPDLSRAQLEADDVDLYAGLRGVAGLVAGARGLIDLLGDAAEFAARAIPGVDGAGVALIQPHEDTPRFQTWAATAEFVYDIDTVQYEELHEGPCITCTQSRRVTVSGSLGSDSRWPHFGGRVARMAVHSALSLPLMVGDRGDRRDQCLCPQPRRVWRARRAVGYAVRRAGSGVGVQRPVARPCPRADDSS